MPLLIALALIVAAFVFAVGMLPFALVFRYRSGTRKRRARVWVATINAISLAISATIFMISAAITARWVPYLVYWAGVRSRAVRDRLREGS